MGIQQILSIGSLLLFTYLLLMFSSSSNIQYDTSNFNEAVIVATGIGESLSEQIQKRAFDERTIDAAFNSEDSLSSVDSLKFDTGEYTVDTFDDVDDFNNYTLSYNSKLGSFDTTVKVYYISKLLPDVVSTTPTFLKRYDIYVTNPYLALTEGTTDTLVFSGIISY